MKNLFTPKGIAFLITVLSFVVIPSTLLAQSGGRIFQKVLALQQKGLFTSETALFSVDKSTDSKTNRELTSTLKQFTVLDITGVSSILQAKPAYIKLSVPVDNGKVLVMLLYKESISPNGFSLLTSDGKTTGEGDVVHYRGAIDGDENSVAAFTFSAGEVAGLASNQDGNFVIGKIQGSSGKHVVYNDKNVINKAVFDCGTNTSIPQGPGAYYKAPGSAPSLTTKCVNWYWETDYDLFTAKGSLANVNTYMQGIFNQVSTLYANDGISITLKTLFIWTTTDPYTGTSTSNYLDQFGVYRTTFDGDLATLIGTKGGGGIAWINGLCNSQARYKMGYCGINTSYATVPNYSWTVEVITHEQGHLLGSRHTHDCAWNGNNTKIDGCGDNAGYPSGSCANPGNPAGGGTIMSYCHLLTAVGINFNLGFGPQPTALIINNVNNASCLTNCSQGCNTPGQPGAITGNASVCSGTAQTYSVSTVAGATSYTWVLPSGWSGSSTSNTINVTAGSVSGTISVTPVNSCGSGTVRTLAVTSASVPAQPGSISGNSGVCPGSALTYSISPVAGATSYTWTIPAGWSGSSTTTSINVTAGSAGGNISVKSTNNCGSSAVRALAVSISASAPAQPGAITGATTVCPGTVQTYSVSAVPNATSYNWTLPSGWSGSSISNSINVTAGSGAGNISVSASNGCGTSAAQTLAVNAGGTAPATPGIITVTGGSAKVCTGDNRTYTVPAVAGITYNWLAPSGATITSGQGTNSVSLLFTSSFASSGTLSVTASNSCGASPASNIVITRTVVTRPGNKCVRGSARVCPGDVRTYSVVAVAGVTYSWVAPSGSNITSGQGSSTVTIAYNSNFISNGTLSVSANTACGVSTPRTLSVVRNVAGAPGPISGPANVCPGSTAVYSVSPVAAATSYIWVVPGGGTIQGPANGNSITVQWASAGGSLSVRSTNNCGNSGSRSLKIIISCPRNMRGSTFIQNEFAGDATVFPNPTADVATIRFNSADNSMYSITLSDLTGRKLMMDKINAVTGSNDHKLSLTKFTKGTYFITIENKTSKQVLKINVQ